MAYFYHMKAHLIYHPERCITKAGGFTIYHDSFGSNEDPYIWNDQFLHTFCHITQLSNEKGQINFWVSGNSYPDFDKLFCDCVFVVKEKKYWNTRNVITLDDSLVDNDQTFEHHYKWVNPPHNQHYFKKRRRYTIKADEDKSFQPQDEQQRLIDILPFLNKNGVSTQHLINSMTSKRGSRPFKLGSNIGQELYDHLKTIASVKLFGRQLKNLHP
eukprot:Plantae.Rhodophyta-Purpureofilum_apyrenoidigerum.ctg16284.p1 GENE.Plantae.Rhodophyta-Purpureofilum_apyrenoidigerum.ctg16284~~Plantae.Rhodophyta-Purpureofilum_apyrenoidigerum.ctg16284.p1  ORF type:complete len:214 (+),score=3.72 Plantae.Rhodophyta-Purpureofilum_apyrenoidigerum.ctg16284:796-1437(+)